VNCPQCHAENEDGAAFCGSCGAKLPEAPADKGGEKITCAKCGGDVEPGVRFCGTCGARMNESEPHEPPQPVVRYWYPAGKYLTRRDLEMLRDAAESARKLEHPRIAGVVSVRWDELGLEVAVARPEGDRLDRWLEGRDPVSLETWVSVAESVLGALSYAHKQDVLHEDICPENIWVDGEGTATLTGFAFRAVERDLRALREGTPWNRVLYMAPEQILDGERSEATDLYGLGAVLYELLCGRPPFERGDVCQQIVKSVPRRPSELRRNVPELVDEMVMRCLEKVSEARFQTADDLQDELVSHDVAAEADVSGELRLVDESEPVEAEETEELLSFESRSFGTGEGPEAVAGLLEAELEEEEAETEETVVIESAPGKEYRREDSVEGVPLGEVEEEREQRESTAILKLQDAVREAFETALRLHNEGNYSEAIQHYTDVIGEDGTFAPAYSNRALAYYDMGEYDLATQDYGRALELNPKFADAYLGRGLAHYKKGQIETAISDYQQALRCDPENAVAHYNCGIAHYDLDEYDEAVSDYTEVLKRDPEHATAYYNRGIANYKLGKWDEAIDDFNHALELNENHHTAYYNRGSIYHKMKQFDKALEDFTRAVEIKPDYVMAFYSRGSVHTKLGQLEEAIADYTEVIKLSPNFAQAYFSRGCIYGNVAEYLKAVRDFDQAVTLNPNYGAAFWNRAIAYEMLGYKSKARRDFQKADELGYKPK
jgi:tetratricopeptide (TPR) repeat protein